MTTHVETERDIRLQGQYAGIASRFSAFVVDLAIVTGVFSLGGRLLEFLVSSLGGDSFQLAHHETATRVAFAIWAFSYSVYCLAVGGRTPGLALFGLRVLRHDGRELDTGHAVVRTLVFPFSFALLLFGFVLILLDRDRRALHDLIAGTGVVYDWDARGAHLRFLGRHPASSASALDALR
jgi:uncharacterized RDD family membrane protein YckC